MGGRDARVFGSHCRRRFRARRAQRARRAARRDCRCAAPPTVDQLRRDFYSMVLIEHFAETDEALANSAACCGPAAARLSRAEPPRFRFLSCCLSRSWTGSAGMDMGPLRKLYSRRRLRGMLATRDFASSTETGILFIPGWALRMADSGGACVVPRDTPDRARRQGVRVDRRASAARAPCLPAGDGRDRGRAKNLSRRFPPWHGFRSIPD